MRGKHEDIRGALRLRGLTFTDIARTLAVAPATVGLVSQGKGRSERVERAIALALRMEPHELWPERYRQTAYHGEVEMPGP